MELHLAVFVWALAHTLAAPVLDSPVGQGEPSLFTLSPSTLETSGVHSSGVADDTSVSPPTDYVQTKADDMHQKTGKVVGTCVDVPPYN